MSLFNIETLNEEMFVMENVQTLQDDYVQITGYDADDLSHVWCIGFLFIKEEVSRYLVSLLQVQADNAGSCLHSKRGIYAKHMQNINIAA